MLTRRYVSIHYFPLSLTIYFRTSHWRIFSHEKVNIDRPCLRSVRHHHVRLSVTFRYDILVSHDRNPIIITRICVKDVKLAAYTADQSFGRIFCFTGSPEEITEDFFPAGSQGARSSREITACIIYRIQSACVHIVPSSPSLSSYSLPLPLSSSTSIPCVNMGEKDKKDTSKERKRER